jgi:WD repeat-containing protein 23
MALTLLAGHTEGITHVDPKGDGYHVISNCKDQTIKLWDTRAAVSTGRAAASARLRPRIPRWDYRWEDYPGV